MFRFEFAKACWFTPLNRGRWGLPLFLNGQPGVGKSEIISHYAKMCGLHTKVLLGSLMDPTDLAGMPVPEKNYVRYLPAKWVHDMNEAQAGLLFLDEFRGCSPEVQNAMLRVVLDRVVGDVDLHEDVRVIAAANPVEQTSGGFDLAPPMNNRFTHLDWEGPNAKQYSAYHAKGGETQVVQRLDPFEEQARVMKLWPAAYAKAVAMVTSFLNKNSEKLSQKPHADGSPAYATQRSWETMMRIIATSEVHKLTPEESAVLMNGTVGSGPTIELIAFQELADLPDIEQVLDGKVKFAHDPARPDRTHVTLTSCGTLVSNKACEDRVGRANTLYRVVKQISDERPDLCIDAMHALLTIRGSGIDQATKSKVLRNMGPMLEASEYSAVI